MLSETVKRRTFITGLGTVTTLSGVASITGATISGTVDAGASFQIITDRTLTVRRNTATFPVTGEINNDTDDNYVNTTVEYVETEGQINGTMGSGAENVSTPQLTVNDGEDDALEFGITTPNNASVPDNTNVTPTPYNSEIGSGIPPLEIQNEGGSQQTIAVNYDFSGTDVTTTGGSGAIGNDVLEDVDIAQLLTFSIEGEQISPGTANPNSSGDESGNSSTISPNTSKLVDFTLNYSDGIENDIDAAKNGGTAYDYETTGFASLNILNAAIFGIVD
jgi:hypothetical protein